MSSSELDEDELHAILNEEEESDDEDLSSGSILSHEKPVNYHSARKHSFSEKENLSFSLNLKKEHPMNLSEIMNDNSEADAILNEPSSSENSEQTENVSKKEVGVPIDPLDLIEYKLKEDDQQRATRQVVSNAQEAPIVNVALREKDIARFRRLQLQDLGNYNRVIAVGSGGTSFGEPVCACFYQEEFVAVGTSEALILLFDKIRKGVRILGSNPRCILTLRGKKD